MWTTQVATQKICVGSIYLPGIVPNRQRAFMEAVGSSGVKYLKLEGHLYIFIAGNSIKRRKIECERGNMPFIRSSHIHFPYFSLLF